MTERQNDGHYRPSLEEWQAAFAAEPSCQSGAHQGPSVHYRPSKEEWKAAYEAEPACHHQTEITDVEPSEEYKDAAKDRIESYLAQRASEMIEFEIDVFTGDDDINMSDEQ